MLNASQIRAARALLGWSGSKLSAMSGVGVTTIRRYELETGIPSANVRVLAKPLSMRVVARGSGFPGNASSSLASTSSD